MLVSGIQKITLLSCLVLSMALFLPKLFFSAGEEKVVLQSEAVGPGRLPALKYSHGASSGDHHWTPDSLYTPSQKPKTFSQTNTFRKSTLLAQVTPIYGFGIFLYIIHILYKLTNKDRVMKQHCRFSVMIPENTAEELPEDEMDQLQTRLKELEGQTERKTSKCVQNPARYRKYRTGREERKLQHQRKITHMLVEGRSLEDVTPELEAEETPYSADWEGYPEETFPQYEVSLRRRRHSSVILEEPYGDVPTAEELAERIEREDEEDEKNEEETEDDISEDEDGPEGMKGDGELKQPQLCENVEETGDNEDDAHEEVYKQDEDEEEEVGEDQPCLTRNCTDEKEMPNSAGNQKEGETSKRRRQITFSNHRHVFHYPKGGAVGCSYEDEEVEEDAPEDEDEDDDGDVEEDKPDEDADLQEMEMEDDPLMEAERLDFSTQFTCDPDEQEVDLIDFLLTFKPEVAINSDQPGAAEAPAEVLRRRYKNQKKQTCPDLLT